jgi:hypothetical protein
MDCVLELDDLDLEAEWIVDDEPTRPRKYTEFELALSRVVDAPARKEE